MHTEDNPPFPKHLGPMTLLDALVLLPTILEDDQELAAIVEAIKAQDAFRLLLIMSACHQRAAEINEEDFNEPIDHELEANLLELYRDQKRWEAQQANKPKPAIENGWVNIFDAMVERAAKHD